MGHEGFYNSLLVAMGNVVSALFMYALQAAWLCQRLIDQDYRQNHGSRLKPLVDCKNVSESVEIVSERSSNREGRYAKSQKLDATKFHGESQKRQEESKKRKYEHRGRLATNATERRINSSHPYLKEFNAVSTTAEYVNRFGQNLTLRRAFSDININSSCSEFGCVDSNQNYLSRGNIDETTVALTDQDFLSSTFSKGYVT